MSPAPLLNVDAAVARILTHIPRLPDEAVPLMAARGRVLAAPVTAALNLPPFANSSMDGYAVRAEDTTSAPVTLSVVLDIPAGSFPAMPLHFGQAARIMTGAPLPDGADAIVPVEETDDDYAPGDPPPARVAIHKAAQSGANVRPVGENVRQGQTVLQAGIELRPQDIGLLASIGQAEVQVARQPRVAILTTGDELLNPGEPLTPGKIYDANSYTLAGLVTEHGGIPLVLPRAGDHLDAVRTLFRDALALQPDLVMSSAGVSVGAADYVRLVLEELGQVDFWRINLRPGKPLAFGMLNGADGGQVPFFGLPGNPVSAMVTFDVCVRPALLKMQGRTDEPATLTALAAEDFTSDGRRSYLRVRLSRDGGQVIANLTGTQSSGALYSMVIADGLLIVPEGVTQVRAGDPFTVRLLR